MAAAARPHPLSLFISFSLREEFATAFIRSLLARDIYFSLSVFFLFSRAHSSCYLGKRDEEFRADELMERLRGSFSHTLFPS